MLVMNLRLALMTVGIGTIGATLGCASDIGDACSTNLDCSTVGDRICDTSQKEGYCTIAGCGPVTCADGAVCVRFFPAPFLSVACDPKTEDAVNPDLKATNDCIADEICLTSGYCVQRASERRFCMKSCEANQDCRQGYECRATGTQGAESLIDVKAPQLTPSLFCGQMP